MLGKSLEITVTHTTMEYRALASLEGFYEKRKCSPELLGLGGTPIEILKVDTGSTMSDGGRIIDSNT